MSYKLIAIDMDGTLLNNKQQVSSRNKEMITKLSKRGVNFVLASGRPYQAMHHYTDDLDVYLPLVTANGAIIKSTLNKKNYYKSDLPLDLAKEVLNYALDNDFSVSIYFEDTVFTCSEEMAKAHQDLEGIEAKVMDKLNFEEPPVKIIYYDQAGRIEKACDYLNDKYQDDLYITSSDQNYLEVMNLNVSKGIALEYMMKEMNFSKEEVMAIGNNYNDVAMFEIAGFAVAMGNSPEGVKEKADFVTKSNEDDGVAYALEKIVLKQN